MTKEKNRPEKEPEKDEKAREPETDRVEEEPGENWEEEKQQGKEIVNKALNKVKSKLEEQ